MILNNFTINIKVAGVAIAEFEVDLEIEFTTERIPDNVTDGHYQTYETQADFEVISIVCDDVQPIDYKQSISEREYKKIELSPHDSDPKVKAMFKFLAGQIHEHHGYYINEKIMEEAA